MNVSGQKTHIKNIAINMAQAGTVRGELTSVMLVKVATKPPM